MIAMMSVNSRRLISLIGSRHFVVRNTADSILWGGSPMASFEFGTVLVERDGMSEIAYGTIRLSERERAGYEPDRGDCVPILFGKPTYGFYEAARLTKHREILFQHYSRTPF